MIRDFTKEDLETEEEVRDTELTLGGGTLFVLGGGLLALCVLCFVLGYAVGHRTSTASSAANIFPTSSVTPPFTPVGSGSKPGAGQAQSLAQVRPAANISKDASGDSAQSAQVIPTSAEKSAGSTQSELTQTVDSQVEPFPGGPHSVSPSPAIQILPPMVKTQGWMVQIAAVSKSEDADVLVNALRRRGYSATARRDNEDTLIHVQTGPFVNRNDANAMRQKLLNDGYNAVVQ